MKTSLPRKLLLVTTSIAIFAVQPTQAATRDKANNTTDLNLAGSWSVALPGTNDIARWTSNVTTANTVSLGADLSWLGLGIVNPGGTVNISTGNTLTLGRGGIDMSAATQDLTIASNLTLNSNNNQVWNIATGRTLSVTGNTTRSSGATLNIQGGGTVATNLTNNASGIVGNWLTIGTGTSTRYATVSGGNIVGYTGTAAATAADVTDTTGTVNYEVAAVGTLGAGASFNTLRYSGANGTISGAFQANGLMNAGTGLVTLGGNVTIGSEKEFVLNGGANASMIFNGVISDNAGGASGIIKTGVNTVTLNGANTYTGDTVVTLGILDLYNSNALGTTAGRTIVSGAAAASSGNPAILGGQLRFRGSGLAIAESLTLIGLGNNDTGILSNYGNNNILSGAVTLSGPGSVRIVGVGSGTGLTFTGGITADAESNGVLLLEAPSGAVFAFTTTSVNLKSTGTFHSLGAGTVELGVAGNTWALTRVDQGMLKMTIANALPSTANLRVGSNSTATLDLNGFNQTTGSLLIGTTGTTRTITNGSATAATLTVDQTATGTYDGNLSGNLEFVKNGASNLTLTGAGTHTGNTVVNAGTLILSGTSDLTFTIGANDVNNQITGVGTVTLNGAFTFDLTGAGTTLGDSWNIVNVGTLAETFGATFTVVGFTDNLDNTWSKLNGGITYTFAESSGLLSVAAIPEPSTIGFFALSLVLVPVFFRRRLDAKNKNLPTTI